jgi:hypothetical protein
LSQEERRVVTASETTKGPLGLLVIGAGLIFATWVIFGLIAGEWNPGTIYTALALLVLLSAFGIGGLSIGVQTKRVIGWFFGLAALVIILSDIRYDGFPNEAIDWIAYILFVVGAVMMFLGARQLSD